MPHFSSESQIKKNLDKLASYGEELATSSNILLKEWNYLEWKAVSEQVEELIQTSQQLVKLSQQIQQEIKPYV